MRETLVTHHPWNVRSELLSTCSDGFTIIKCLVLKKTSQTISIKFLTYSEESGVVKRVTELFEDLEDKPPQSPLGSIFSSHLHTHKVPWVTRAHTC